MDVYTERNLNYMMPFVRDYKIDTSLGDIVDSPLNFIMTLFDFISYYRIRNKKGIFYMKYNGIYICGIDINKNEISFKENLIRLITHLFDEEIITGSDLLKLIDEFIKKKFNNNDLKLKVSDEIGSHQTGRKIKTDENNLSYNLLMCKKD